MVQNLVKQKKANELGNLRSMREFRVACGARMARGDIPASSFPPVSPDGSCWLESATGEAQDTVAPLVMSDGLTSVTLQGIVC